MPFCRLAAGWQGPQHGAGLVGGPTSRAARIQVVLAGRREEVLEMQNVVLLLWFGPSRNVHNAPSRKAQLEEARQSRPAWLRG